MTVFYNRVYKVEVSSKAGSFSFEQTKQKQSLRITFEFTLSAANTFQSGTMSIYNLSKSHRKLLAAKFRTDQKVKDAPKIKISLGYDSSPTLAFEGQIQRGESTKVGAQWETTLRLTMVVELDNKILNKTVKSEAKQKKSSWAKQILALIKKKAPGMLDRVTKAIDISINKKGGESLARKGITYSGDLKGFLKKLQKDFDLQFILGVNGLDGKAKTGKLGNVINLSEKTGLIGSPSITNRGADLTSLMNPKLRVGYVVAVDSKTTGKQQYSISKVVFIGDSHGEQWQTELTTAYFNKSTQ